MRKLSLPRMITMTLLGCLALSACVPSPAGPEPAGELPNISRWPLEIEETFESGAGNGFSLFSESYGQQDQSGGNLCLILTEPQRYNWAVQGDWTDYAVDAVITSLSEGASGGLVYRTAQAEASLYAFEINGQGEYRIARLDPGTPNGLTPAAPGWAPIVDWTKSREIKTGLERNQLTVIAAGEEFWFFINRQPVTSLQDDRLSYGGAGVLVQSGETVPASACFDDFKVFLSLKSH